MFLLTLAGVDESDEYETPPKRPCLNTGCDDKGIYLDDRNYNIHCC